MDSIENTTPIVDSISTKIGVGVLVVRDGKILLGKRKGAHGSGEFAGPGGHLEYMESPNECALREIQEEAGIEVENIRFLCLSNVTAYAPSHYIDIGLIADWKGGEPQVLEPHKLEYWDWFAVDATPDPLFATVKNYIEAYTTGKQYFV